MHVWLLGRKGQGDYGVKNIKVKAKPTSWLVWGKCYVHAVLILADWREGCQCCAYYVAIDDYLVNP